MSTRWKPNRVRIREVAKEYGRARVSRFNRLTTNLAKERVPRKRGRLANSIGSSLSVEATKVRGRVGSRVRYAATVNDGSVAHRIRARRKKALRFYWEAAGRTVIRKSVWHPGSGETPFLTSAARDVARAEGFVWVRNVGAAKVGPYL